MKMDRWWTRSVSTGAWRQSAVVNAAEQDSTEFRAERDGDLIDEC